MKKNVGIIRQQTVNSDYIVCSKNATIHEINADRLQVEQLESPVIANLKTLIQELSQRLSDAEDRITRLESTQVVPYTPGTVVATTLHFDDVDLDTIDQEAFSATLKETLASAAGVEVDSVLLIDIQKSGSATVRIEVQYREGSDTSKKDDLINNLSSPLGLSDILGGLGSVQAEEIHTDLPIVSTQGKLFQLERMITREAVSLENSNEFRMKDHRFIVVEDELRIQRYDHSTNAYVGGNVVLDAS